MIRELNLATQQIYKQIYFYKQSFSFFSTILVYKKYMSLK